MNERRREFQHTRVGELQERELHQDRHHRHQQLQQQQQQDSDIYGTYTAQNNLGVMLLREKRYLDAANCFCQAVKYINERSMYNCPKNDDCQSSDCLRCNQNDACHDHHQSQSSPTPTLWSEIDIDSLSETSSVEADVELRTSTSNRIESFYLLLDEDNGNSSNDSNYATSNNSCSTRSEGKCDVQSSSLSSSDSNNISSNTSQHDGTFIFRNPIIVYKQGDTRRHFLRPMTSSSASNNAANGSTTATVDNDTTIDKESCAKLSLVSVYNMALTYHLAALDNDQNGGTDTGNRNCLDNKVDQKDNDVVAMNSNSSNSLRTAHVPDSSSTYDYTRPTKRQRLCDCNALSVATTRSPFGECNNPYHDRNSSSKVDSAADTTTDSSINNTFNNNTVDHVLLSQALAYYEIAYRILVSEQRVLVSQAMVILNNIGHIHRLMGKEEDAKQCFQRLLTTMVYLQQTGASHQISHWDSFLKNVIDLIVSPECSHKKFAPAA